jgi:hypothetical protein
MQSFKNKLQGWHPGIRTVSGTVSVSTVLYEEYKYEDDELSDYASGARAKFRLESLLQVLRPVDIPLQ